jgi:hypothetical protein
VVDDEDKKEGLADDPYDWYYKLPDEEKLSLAIGSMRRSDARASGLEVLKKRFPSAPQAMLDSAIFHLYLELPRALRDLLAQIELSITKPEGHLHWGVTYEALYHLYNYLQLEALMPGAQQHLLDHVRDLKDCLTEKNLEGAVKVLEDIENHLEACIPPPDFD